MQVASGQAFDDIYLDLPQYVKALGRFDMLLVKFNESEKNNYISIPYDSKVIIINMSENVDSRWC